MSEQTDGQAPDIVQLWRDWLTQSERQFNAFFAEAMNTEEFARSVAGYTELYTSFQRMLTQGMERYLGLINMPSRTDIVAVAETLRAMEERLARIEEWLQIAAEAGGVGDRGAGAPPGEPTRTRRPAGVPAAEKAGDEETIPAGLRR